MAASEFTAPEFGTDGLRGRAGEPPMDTDTLQRVGAALGIWLQRCGPEDKRVLIGNETDVRIARLQCDWACDDDIQTDGRSGRCRFGRALTREVGDGDLCEDTDRDPHFSSGIHRFTGAWILGSDATFETAGGGDFGCPIVDEHQIRPGGCGVRLSDSLAFEIGDDRRLRRNRPPALRRGGVPRLHRWLSGRPRRIRI